MLFQQTHTLSIPEVSKLWGAPSPTGAVDPLSARVVCVRNIFVLIEMWEQDVIYILIGTLLGLNILHTN
jgi:hypothetical protein